MFTGIIEEVGRIKEICRGADFCMAAVECAKVLEGTGIGDSIAVNGVCLTVTAAERTCFRADVMHETMKRSALTGLKPGDMVNLERAMAAAGRFGGHIVTGHIDGTGTIIDIKKDGIAVWYTIKTEDRIMRYIIEKGSVAVDGISLTVADVRTDSFRISVIPHTLSQTTLSSKRPGDPVNLENDCVGKYIEHLIKSRDRKENGITAEFLTKYGY